jgi:hypothetical protein
MKPRQVKFIDVALVKKYLFKSRNRNVFLGAFVNGRLHNEDIDLLHWRFCQQYF